MGHPKDISINDFTYELPVEKIAVYPLKDRDESKLLVFREDQITESTFKNIDTFLAKESVLIFNTTKVIRARLNFLNKKEQAIEIFCLEPDGQNLELTLAMNTERKIRWNCLVGNLKRWKEEVLEISKNGISLFAELIERKNQQVLIEFSWTPESLHFSEVLEAMGNTPIPPYIKRVSDETDAERYQTIYAHSEGSVAAPTAGLHMTNRVLDKLKSKSIKILSVTLHVGAGTFKPVKAESMAEHEMHSEWIDVELSTIQALIENLSKSIIPLGTTSLRTIESLYWMGLKAHLNKKSDLTDLEIKQWDPYGDLNNMNLSVHESLSALVQWMKSKNLHRLVCHTQILIAPPYELKIAKGIITNFHQPQSTLLLLISSIVGDKWKRIYDYALENDFRFLSYGDSSLLLK